jgi:nucleoid DNA-binding protein
MPRSKTIKIDDMVNQMCARYRHLEPETTKNIIESFCKMCKDEILNGRDVRVSKIGKFMIKQKAEKMSKDIFGNRRKIPKMYVPYFKPTDNLRGYINSEADFGSKEKD